MLVVVGVRWLGIAEAGEVVGKGWLKWMTCEVERFGLCPLLGLR